MKRVHWVIFIYLCVMIGSGQCQEHRTDTVWKPDQPLLVFETSAVAGGAVVEAKADLRDVADALKLPEPISPDCLRVVELGPMEQRGVECTSQFEPGPEDARRGIVAWRTPTKAAGSRRFGLFLAERPVSRASAPGLHVTETGESVTVENSFFKVIHPKLRNGGLPVEILFKASGRIDREILFNDRLHSREKGGFHLRHDVRPVVTVLNAGPVRATIGVSARYLNDKGIAPESQPRAVYRFSYLPDSPLISISAEITQTAPFTWNELHFLELFHKKPFFPNWALGEGGETGTFRDARKGFDGREWGALFGPQDALGLFSPGRILLYDGASHYGTYLHGPWIANWGEQRWSGSAMLYLGPSGGSARPIAVLAAEAKDARRVRVRMPALDARLLQIADLVRKTNDGLPQDHPTAVMNSWNWITLKRRAEIGEAFAETAREADTLLANLRRAERTSPLKPLDFASEEKDSLVRVTNGFIGIGLDATKNNLRVGSLLNALTSCEMAGKRQVSLWEIEFRNSEGNTLILSASGHSHRVHLEAPSSGGNAALRASAQGCALGDEKDAVDVQVEVRLEKKSPFSQWRIQVVNRSKTWGIWEVKFPQIQVGGEKGFAAYPSGWGVLLPLDGRAFNYQTVYPSGGCAMQFGAFTAGESGLYFAAHDGRACTKRLLFASDGASADMTMSLGHYPEGMGIPGKNYDQPYDVILGAFKGDWFTASKIYREWALKQKWCAKGRIADRADISPRVKNIALWALSSGAASQTISGLLKFKERFGVPLATHWYNWHVIPFDNSYPEYFPPKPGFKSGVRMATDAGILVMPYINGRLWDVEIVSFAKEAVRYATRDAQGRAYIEQYGSKRMLAPMCPWTKLWQEKVAEIVWRLVDEYGVSGVYTDQVGAAAPRFCMDASHGHPLGGGSWWVEGYDKMLAPLRTRLKAKYPDAFLTTESNAEPYIDHYDAYLMCNSTQGNLIPMFSSVYSDMILTFGRYTFEGDAKDENAFYMKEGELFVFGGQLGWIGYFPADPKYQAQGDYLKALSECRAAAQKYMALGEMLRPLKYQDEMPKVTGEWVVWRTRQKVELPAVMNSVWRAPDGTVGIALTNMSGAAVSAKFEVDPVLYGLPAKNAYTVEAIYPAPTKTPYPAGKFLHSERMPPRSVRFLVVR